MKVGFGKNYGKRYVAITVAHRNSDRTSYERWLCMICNISTFTIILLLHYYYILYMYIVRSVIHLCILFELISCMIVLLYIHFLICNPKFCINQAIQVIKGDFLYFPNVAFSYI